jgi:transposase
LYLKKVADRDGRSYQKPRRSLGLHTSLSRDFAKATGKLAKTDAIEAQVLAHFRKALKPAATVFASQSEEELQALVSRRRQLVDMLWSEKNRSSIAKQRVLPNNR